MERTKTVIYSSDPMWLKSIMKEDYDFYVYIEGVLIDTYRG